MTETLYIVDGHSQIFRAYWAPMNELSSPTGEPTKATYIFSQMVLNLLKRTKPDYLVMAMDGPEGPRRRLELHDEYKANRERMPEDLVPQIRRIGSILAAASIPTLYVEGEEADDVIATLVEQLKERSLDIYLVSRDKDLYQLLGPTVKLFDPQKDVVLDGEALYRAKGFRPEQALEIQTLTGDTVDNIPGVDKVGIKKAVVLIEKYGTAEAVLAHADELTPKLRENILAFGPIMDRTRELVRLRRDCPLTFDLESARTAGFTVDRLAPIFEELGFRRLHQAVAGRDAAAESTTGFAAALETADSLQLESAVSEDELARVADRIRTAGACAVDTETTSLRPRDAELVGISLAWEAGGGIYIPLQSRNGPTADRTALDRHIVPLLEASEIRKVGQNVKYDLQILRGAGIELRGIHFDTMVASYLLNPQRQSHGMDFLAREFLSYETISITELIGKKPKQISIAEADPELLVRYAAEDAAITWRLWEKLAPELPERGVEKLFTDVEMPLVIVLADMEWHGIKVDTALLKSISEEFGDSLTRLEDLIWKEAGRSFNVDSPKQLAEVLFDDLGLEVVKRTKTARSTDAEVLQTLNATSGHPLPKIVLRYRELSKLKGTYVDALPQLVSPTTGRLHPSYHQAVAATGRLSASDPNIQNIPIRTEEGRRVRNAFVAGATDNVLLTADYSQVELRILAHFSKDPVMLQAFEAGEDIHRWVASEIWGMPPVEVPRHLRDQAKAVNFGIIYGQTAFGLARTLGIPRTEAARFIDAYKQKFTGITAFVDSAVKEANETGGVRTLLGRYRPISEIGSRNRVRRQQAERFAVNTVIQGSAADLIKRAMVDIHRLLAATDAAAEAPVPGSARMIAQVHDELVFEVAEREVELLASLVEEAMVNALPMSVPLKVDLSWGRSWLEGKPG